MASRTKRALAIALLGLGLTGGAAIAADPTPTTPSGSPATTQPGSPPQGGTMPGGRGQGPQGQGPQGQPGQPGQGGPGRGGRDQGGPGAGPQAAPTTASVTNELTRIGQELTSVKADRDYANGKMDLAIVNALIDKATALQGQAQGAATANDLTKAGGYARAASSSLRSARDLIVATIGTTGLPSAANRAAPQAPTNAPAAPSADQQKARASSDLARAYQDIVNDGTLAKANGGVSDLGFYVTTAQTLYKQAYDLYNAGKYDQAAQTAHAAQNVGHTANDLLRANGVTAAPAVVTVPAPNF